MSALPGSQNDLNGAVPDSCPAALLLIDVINGFQFPGGERLLEASLEMAPRIRELKARMRAAGIPAIYVNDNFGRWQSSFEKLVACCTKPGMPGRFFVQQIAPEPDDYFVLKPKHSAFFQTPLDLLLKHLGAKKLVLTGLSTDSCVLFTAQDAYMRSMELLVPSDCVATFTPEYQAAALSHMERNTRASVMKQADLNLKSLLS